MRRPLALAALALALAGCGAAGGGAHARAAAANSAPKAHTAASVPVMPVTQPSVRPLDLAGAPPAPDIGYGGGTAPEPVRLRIPVIGVDTGLSRLGLNGDGTIQVPQDFNQAGWYTNGPAPGEPGPAVILGHLDSYTGPAVFYRLSALRPGSQVSVTRADGSQLSFRVERIATFPVSSFPTQDVYGPTADAELRLITCGGTFDYAKGRYQSNVVVFAVLQ